MRLYETLDIKAGASAEDIKRAHRRKAMANHPDRGGDREEFERVQLAFEVLSDPERRAHYDRTGEILGEARDETVQILMTMLAGVFMQVVQAIAAAKQPVENCLFIESMIRAIDASLAGIAEARPQKDAALAMFEKMLGRFSAPGDKPNHLETILRAQIDGVKVHTAKLDAEEQRLKMAKQYLSDCSYRTDTQTVMTGIWTQTINASATTTC